MRVKQNRPCTVRVRGMASTERVMWITPDRVFYAGLLGTPSARKFGGLGVYVALHDSALRVSVNAGEWQVGNVAVLPPYTSHRIACDARHIVAVMVEPESVALDLLPDWLRLAQGVIVADDFRHSILRAHQALLRNGKQIQTPMLDFDALVFGKHLPQRKVDPRIAQVIERICADPASQTRAQDCATQACLSFCRFLHLFKSEVGVSFRSFRAWKRARSLLHYVVNQQSTLTDVALSAGYPDATHFSHSIRHIYGLKPKDIYAGSRKLHVIGTTLSTYQ